MSESATHPIDELVLPHGILLEGIVTTLNEDGSTNISPMGPILNRALSRLRLRPYQTSTTYQNLKRHGEGIFHITDDVLLLAQAAVGEVSPPLSPAAKVRGNILTSCCQWLAFQVESINDAEPRTEILARVVDSGRARDFLGFNRARHAVVEAAILATRLEFLPPKHVQSEFGRLAVLVDKTGGTQEHEAFAYLKRYVKSNLQKLADLQEPAAP